MPTETTVSEDRRERREEPVQEHVTIIKEGRSGSGMALIAVLLVIAVLIAVAVVWANGRSDTDQAITTASEAVTDASQAVGSAAEEVGDAARNAN